MKAGSDKQQLKPSDISVIIPSLNPDNRILHLVDDLIRLDFKDIIIVNDGSKDDSRDIFDCLNEKPECCVLNHAENLGKGSALRTAFSWYIKNNNFEGGGVVTVDGDGQHLPEDVLSCCETMLKENSIVLGCRDFSAGNVPPKSHIGNRITSFVFRFGCGIYLTDTQTGLRVIPARYVPFMLEISGNRFEYETNMLLEMKRAGIEFKEIKIRTVYEERNQGTHFRAIRDSLRIYSLILKFMISSSVAGLIDKGLFYLFAQLSDTFFHSYNILICSVVSRALSCFVNYNVNRKIVFECKNSNKYTLLRYCILCVPQALLSAGLTWIISEFLTIRLPWLVTIIKIIVDVILFFISFYIQREWVFKESAKGFIRKAESDYDNKKQ